MASKRGRRKKKDSTTLTSGAFFEIEPMATSSPTKQDAEPFQNVEVIAHLTNIQKEAEEQRKEMYNEVEVQIRRLVKLFKLKLGKKCGSTVFEEFTVGCDKENSRNNNKVTYSKTPPAPCSSNHIEPSLASNVPVIKNEDTSVFKVPQGIPWQATQDRSSNSKIVKTPAGKRMCGYKNVALVTPGPNIDTPLTVMRRPMVGEMAISLGGSPLLVSTDLGRTEMPQLSLPIEDKIISILPRGNRIPEEEIPLVSETTRQQLMVLRSYLDDICNA